MVQRVPEESWVGGGMVFHRLFHKVLWEFLSANSFWVASLRAWLLCVNVISYKGKERSPLLSWEVRA